MQAQYAHNGRKVCLGQVGYSAFNLALDWRTTEMFAVQHSLLRRVHNRANVASKALTNALCTLSHFHVPRRTVCTRFKYCTLSLLFLHLHLYRCNKIQRITCGSCLLDSALFPLVLFFSCSNDVALSPLSGYWKK